MRTSATGRSERGLFARYRSARGTSLLQRAGFTLVELMATLAIIGLAAGAVMLTLPDTTPKVGDEAARLGARLTAAREEAVMTNRAVAIEANARGYEARVFDGTGWKPLTDGPFGAETWAEGTSLSGEAVRVAFDPTGVAEPAVITLNRDKARATVAVDGAGEVRIR